MPILEVELVGPPAGAGRRALARRLADAAGEALGAPPGHCWVRLRRLPLVRYAENGGPLPRGLRPVFVRVLLYEWPRGPRLGTTAHVLAEAIAAACGRPAAQVHVLFEPPARGRMAFGGRLVT